MGKNKNKEAEVIEEPPKVDKAAVKLEKKAQRSAERAAKKEETAKNAAPVGPPDSMEDANLFLSNHGVPSASGLARLHVHWDNKELQASSSVFSKTKAAHRFLLGEPDVDWDASLTSEPCTLLMVRPFARQRSPAIIPRLLRLHGPAAGVARALAPC